MDLTYFIDEKDLKYKFCPKNNDKNKFCPRIYLNGIKILLSKKFSVAEYNKW